jgi:heptosyltransferase-3
LEPSVVPENKILVIRGGAIGDFILTLPVLAALRQQFPQTRIELLGYPHIAQLAVAGGLADAVRPIEARALAGFFARGGTLAPELADYFACFAIIVSYLYDPDGIFQDNIARVAKTQFIAGPHRPDESATLHATETFLKPLERLAIFAPDPVPRLSLNASRFTLHASRPLLAFHSGSGSERKNWPERHWRELLSRLLDETDFQLLLIGGEVESERVAALARTLSSARVQLALNLPLPELADRFRSCRAFVGHDSGISHLAAAVGLPVLALWGETAEAIWKPAGDNVRLLHGGPALAGITVEQALAAARELFERRR